MIEVAMAILIVSFAMFVRGFTGFGGALLTVPLLSLIWDVQMAIVVVAAIQVVTGGTLAIISRQSIARIELTRVLIPSFAGLAVGAVLLSSLPIDWISRALGIFAVAVGLHMLLRARRLVPVRDTGPATMTGVGLAAGLLQGMVGTGGPVIVPYLQRVLRSAASLRSTLLTYFLVLDILRLGSYVPLGIAGRDAIAPSIYLLPFAVVASLAGGRLQIQVSDVIFRVSVALLMVLAGGLLLV